MSSEITLWDQPISPVQTAFNWDETFAETKKLVKRDAELTATIDNAMVERFHVRVKIGLNLMALQEEHSRLGGGKGDFTTHILPELEIDERSSQRYTSVARLEQNMNPTRVSGSDLFDLPMPMNTWYKLASPSGQPVVRQLESGEINPTREDITKALEDLAEERKRNKELKQELEAKDKEVETNEQAHIALVQSLEQELEKKPEPVKVVEYQDTLETAAKVATLEAKIQEKETKIYELEGKPIIPPETQAELDKLQLELKNAKIERDFYAEHKEKLAEEVKTYQEASGRTFEEITALAGQLRIRQVWQYATTEFQASVRKFHSQIPSAIDLESFEGEEHTRTAQTIEVLEQTIAILKQLISHSGDTLEQADIVDAELFPIPVIHEGPTISTDYDELFDQYKQYVKGFPDEKLWWRAPNGGIMDMEMDRDAHITYTRELLKSGDPYRIRCAIEGMKRTLGYGEIAV